MVSTTLASKQEIVMKAIKTDQKINELFENGDSFDPVEIRLADTDRVSVLRIVKGSLGPRERPVMMTVQEAIKSYAWDTCGGTMGVYIMFRRWRVYLHNGRPIITVRWTDDIL